MSSSSLNKYILIVLIYFSSIFKLSVTLRQEQFLMTLWSNLENLNFRLNIFLNTYQLLIPKINEFTINSYHKWLWIANKGSALFLTNLNTSKFFRWKYLHVIYKNRTFILVLSVFFLISSCLIFANQSWFNNLIPYNRILIKSETTSA